MPGAPSSSAFGHVKQTTQHPRSLQATEVHDLREKYERMLALRTAHARARSDAAYVEPDPREEMKKLARSYPGALREIDVLPIEEITRRIDALRLAEADASLGEPWMIALSSFHRLARGVLATKRWLAGRKEITDEARVAFVSEARAEAQAFAEDLVLVANPPRGRLMDLVFTKLAATLSVSEQEARCLVFGEWRKKER